MTKVNMKAGAGAGHAIRASLLAVLCSACCVTALGQGQEKSDTVPQGDRCEDRIVMQGQQRLAPEVYRNLRAEWCAITANSGDVIGAIRLTDEPTQAFDAGLETTLDYRELKIGNPLLVALANPKYSGALSFVLAHEFGHYRPYSEGASDSWRRKGRVVSAGAVAVVGATGGGIAAFLAGSKLKKAGAVVAGAAMVEGAYRLYCRNFEAYKQDELDADSFAVTHLLALGRDAAAAASAWVSLARDHGIGKTEPKCPTRTERVMLGTKTIDPHPSLERRQTNIAAALAGHRLPTK